MNEYKQALADAMTSLGKDEKVRFIGYGIAVGNGANGTLAGVPLDRRVETPVSEGLMMGLAIGMSLKGLRPVVYCERMDFLPLMMDSLINQLDSIGRLSGGQYRPAVIIRVMVGSSDKPPFTALTHTRDLTEGIREMVSFPIWAMMAPKRIAEGYQEAHEALKKHRSTMLIDYRNLM